MAHQELSLAAELTVAENILAGLEPRWGGFVDWKRLYQRAHDMLAEFCPAIDAYAPVKSLGMGYRQVVEILKALAWEPKVIIFDEPTSALELNEAELVLETIGKLKAKSVGVVYISHRMDEVFRISDRITVLRDGKRVGIVDELGGFLQAVDYAKAALKIYKAIENPNAKMVQQQLDLWEKDDKMKG